MKSLPLASASFALVVTAALSAAAEPAKPADDVQEFVFLGEVRPVLVRLQLQVDGKPLQAAWDDCLTHLFAYLDVDGDGVLSKEEAERAPSVDVLLGGVGGGPMFGRRGNAPTGPTMADLDADKDGKVTRDELAAYYRKQGFVPFRYQLEAAPANPLGAAAAFLGGPAPEPSADAVGRAIFDLLDADKTGKLTKEKLTAAPAVLLKLDDNEDELVATRELVPQSGVNLAQIAGMVAMGRPNRPNPLASSANLVPIPTPGQIPADLVQRMKDRYARSDGDDKKIQARDIGLDEATFRQLDADQDGTLNDQELAAFAKRAPDLELVVHLGKKNAGRTDVRTDDGRSPLAAKFHAHDGSSLLDLGRTRAEIRVDAVDRPDPVGGILRQQMVAQFKQADANGDGFLDAKEAADSRAFRGLFKALDRTGAGKVSEKDLNAYLDHLQDLQKRAALGCATLELSDHSRGLFDLLDANRDGQLSVREMRQAPKLLEQLDHDGKGYIIRDDVPRTYKLEIHRGPGNRGGQGGARAFVDAYFTPGEAPTALQEGRGPVWFRKMDRNRDGDVSRKEFLFGDELFREIDADGDGLISLEEAERYDAKHRDKK